MKVRLLLLICLWVTPVFAQKPSKKDYLVTIKTNFGTMNAVLFDETPKHKENFLKLVDEKFYDGHLFHRVIDAFMIQGGDPTSKTATKGQQLGSGGDNLQRIKYEFTPAHFHKIGALAAARDGNPEKASSACQFYIVEGKKYTMPEIEMLEKRRGNAFSEEQKLAYQNIGGTPHLDNGYTVFGQVIDHLDVLEQISKQEKDRNDRPIEDIKMEISAKKMRKKKITKKFGYVYP